MKLKSILYIGVFCCMLYSCRSGNRALEEALQLAGDNRGELEKVLQHYSENPTDSLKLRAARFLIENMPGHYTIMGPNINEFRATMDADTTGSYFIKKVLDISLSKVEEMLEDSYKIEDIQQIKANFLIRHIDLSFEHLYQYSWLEDIPFDLFLEYLLPYRFENERLDLWLDSLHIAPKTFKELSYRKYIKYGFSDVSINSPLVESKRDFNEQSQLKSCNKHLFSDCLHITLKENFQARLSGLPATIDFIPHYANRNGYHYWNLVISPEFRDFDIKGALERRTAKVYRKTYSRNFTPLPSKDEYIPAFFLDPFYKDITDQYLHTVDISVSVRGNASAIPKHVYLCVFNNLSWNPIAISSLKNSQAGFNNMGKNLVYLPICYQKKTMVPVNYPFAVNLSGEVEFLIPDTCHRQKIFIKRKYPFNRTLHYYNKGLKYLLVEASNSPEFQEADTILHQMDTSPFIYSEGKIDVNKRYRYWRISHQNFADLAELIFLDSLNLPLKGKVDSLYMKVFDNDPLTCIIFKEKQKINIDFITPVGISKIICLPRSDGNGIYPGNDYELFYYDLKGWQSLGRRIATNYYLEFDNVPQNALFWLHNYTTGIEERIFTYKNDIIRFW